MKIKAKFPGTATRGSRNWKAVRAAVHKNPKIEARLFNAAERAAWPGQTVFVKEQGRVGAYIVDENQGKKRMDRRKELQAALGRVRV